MNFLHYEYDLSKDEVVEVTLDKQANVKLLDDANFAAFRDGKQYHYHGGLGKTSPVRLVAPHAGHWHLVVDLGGFAGSVRASARVLQDA